MPGTFAPWHSGPQKCVAVSYQMKLPVKQWTEENKTCVHLSLFALCIQLLTPRDWAMIAFLNVLFLLMSFALQSVFFVCIT